jgi:hypothetical protein
MKGGLVTSVYGKWREWCWGLMCGASRVLGGCGKEQS